MIVADTNIIFNYLSDSEQHDNVVKFADIGGPWGSPLFWRTEFLNILATFVRNGKMDALGAQHLWEKAIGFQRLRDFSVDEKLALDMAIRYKTSIYDAQFLALAHEMKTVVVTGDMKLIRAAPELVKNYRDFI